MSGLIPASLRWTNTRIIGRLERHRVSPLASNTIGHHAMTDQASVEIIEHYSSGYEAGRLATGTSRLELARTQIVLQCVLPPPPARILDIGGGPGVYAAWLANLG